MKTLLVGAALLGAAPIISISGPSYFADGHYPARTTTVVSALPSLDFLIEIEGEAILV